jgi:hypothetical protein
MASSGFTVVEHLIHHSKVEGSSPAATATGERKTAKKCKMFNAITLRLCTLIAVGP